jgi:hypothetical protein
MLNKMTRKSQWTYLVAEDKVFQLFSAVGVLVELVELVEQVENDPAIDGGLRRGCADLIRAQSRHTSKLSSRNSGEPSYALDPDRAGRSSRNLSATSAPEQAKGAKRTVARRSKKAAQPT